MGKSLTWSCVAVKRLWLAFCLIALLLNIRLCSAECLSKETHLNCFSKDLLHLADSCTSSKTADRDGTCKDIFPKGTGSPESKEWISAKLVGAWYKVKFTKAFRMTKVIIQQRSGENSQIKDVAIEFDTGPSLQMSLTQNINGTPEAFDQKKFASRSSSTVTFTVLSMHTDNGLVHSYSYVLPGFRTIRIYDENCDRDYQELNIEQRSLSTDNSVVRRWSPFAGSLKMFLTFHETLTFYFSYVPSVIGFSYQFVIDTKRKELGVYKVTVGGKVQMKNESFLHLFHKKKEMFFINRNDTHWEIGHKSGVVKTVEDTSQLKLKYWGIACSSLKPVKLTYWKHIGKCYEKADYFWLADKLIGGTTIAELRQGKDGYARDLNEIQALPFGPFVDGHTSSSLYLTGAYSGGLRLARFHEGCFSDITACSTGYTIAFWVSALDASPANAWKQILWLSNFGFSLNYKASDYNIKIRTETKEYTASMYLGRTHWNHVFIFWDPVNGVKALVNNVIEITGTTSLRNGPARPGFTSLRVGQKAGASTRCARMAIRDIALWERRISLVEAREYYHCNNFEIPREFLTNHRAPLTLAGTFPFPGQNVASPKHGGSCTSNAAIYYRCDRVIDGKNITRSHVIGPNMTIVLTFDQVYVVNKVLFHGHKHEKRLTVKFSDGTTEKFMLTNPKYLQEIHFKDKATNSIEILVESSSYRTEVKEISVYYDFSTDLLPSRYINWALGCRVKKLGSTPLTPFVTDGLTSGAAASVPITSNWIRIELTRAVQVNLIRLWLVDDAAKFDHLKTFKLEFSNGNQTEFYLTLPVSDSDKIYWSEFVFEPKQTDWIDLHLLDTHEMTKGKIGMKEVELFYDTSKDLPASKIIIDENSVHTWEKGLSSAKFGPFDFLLNGDINMTQAKMKILGRKTDQNFHRTIMRTTADFTLYIRVGQHQISSYSVVADGSWHNVKLFYNARESRLSLFIDNRLESTKTLLVPEEPDGWEWESGVTMDSRFTGSLRNFRIHQAVRGFGMATKKILDSALSVTSASSNVTGADMARLFGPGAWVIAPEDNDKEQYLQVDLGIASHVMYVAFQGKGDMWVTSARISYSMDGMEWKFLLDIQQKPQIFRASQDAESVALVMLYSPVVARYIRIYPYLANVGMALRTEIYDHDYGLPFNSRLGKHVPSYQGCIKREELFKLQTFSPLSFKSLASTPEDCKRACALQSYRLAGLFQGAVCYCTEKTLYFDKLADDHCSFPCPGNPVLRCGGEITVSLYEAAPQTDPLCTDCSVEIDSNPLHFMFLKNHISANSSGEAVSYIDVSLNGVHIANLTTGEIEHRFVDDGELYLIAEARDIQGRQVAVTARPITVRYKVFYTVVQCPSWVPKGSTYECYIYIQRGTGTELNCTIDGEYLPLEIDDNILVKTGDIIPEYPAPVVDDGYNSTIILPAQAALLHGVILAFEYVTTGPGNLTIKVFRPSCGKGMKYCQTIFSCMLTTIFSRDCPQGNPPTTAHTFPSTSKVCDTFDAYCPTRKLPSNLTGDYELRYEEYFAFSEAGVHIVAPKENVYFKAGDLIGYSGSINLQHKASGVSFRVEPKNLGFYSPVARIEGRTALLRGHYCKNQKLYFNMNKTGKFSCTFGNDVESNTAKASDYIRVYEKITDVVLTFLNISATNASVLFVVPPHPGGDVKYTFRFGRNETIIIDNQNSSHTLTFNYTFTESGYYQVDLTVRNGKSSFEISSGIHVLDPISDLTWPCPIYARINQLTNISLSAKSGENVTSTAYFGDGATITVGPFDFGPGTEHSVPHTYEIVGSYNTSLVVQNAVSAVSITGLLIAMEAVCNVTVTVATEFAQTDMPVVLSASVAQGTDVQYLVIFNCTETGMILPEQLFTGDRLIMNFTEPCMYDFKVLAYNNVSAEMCNGSLLVEDATTVNLRATVGLVVAGEPTVFTVEEDSGTVVHCTWHFGDGARKTLLFGAVEHVYPTGGKYLLNLNCSNSLKSANTSLDIEVLVYITQLDITTLQGSDTTGYGPGKITFPVEDPLVFEFATNCQFVNFTVNFGDLSPQLVTEDTSIEHLFHKFGSYDVTVNVSNAISYKVASVSLTLLESVKDVAIDSNGPVKLGEEMILEVTMGQMGTYPCYYFNLGDGTEFIYKGYYLANCPAEYNHVTDIRFIMSQVKISFTHTYTNVTVYHVTCVGSNLVSSEVAETRAVLVEVSCTSPIVSIEGLTRNVDDAREFMRSEEFELITKNSIDCQATLETDFEWKVFKVAPEGFSKDESVEILLPDIKTNDWKIVFKSRSLEYGLYYISFTLTMVGVEGVSSSIFGYVKIIPSPITAEVRGGSTRVVGFDKVILLDGGLSRDPDVEQGDYEGMYFYWHCKRIDDNYAFPFEPEAVKPPMIANTTNSTQFVDYGGCFGQGPGRLNYSDTTLAKNIDTGLMRENASYTLQLLVKKDFRRSVFNLFMEIISGDPPTIALTCLRNCLKKFNPTVKVSLEATCQDCRNSDSMNYRWEVYHHTEGSWFMHENFDDVILTRPSSPNLVIREESLLGNRTYKIRVEVWRPGGIPGIAELVRTVNIPPVGGWCFASPLTGYALDTLYGVTCGDWIDDNLPLKYTFSYFPGSGTLESLVYVGENSFSPNVTFPTGQEENNTLYFVVLVTDSLDASTLVQFMVQVNPTNTDALKSKVEDLTSANGTLGTLLSSGDTQNAFQMISAVGNMLNFESEKDEMNEPVDAPVNGTGTQQDGSSETNTQDKKQQVKQENTKLRTSLVKVISTAPVETLEDAHRTSSVLGTVTKETGEVSAEAQETATSTLETVSDVLENAAEKPGTHPRTVAKTAEAVLSGLGNVIQAAFYVEESAVHVPQQPKIDETESENNDASQKSETVATEAPPADTEGENDEILQEKQRKKELANKLMSVIKKVAKAITTNKAPGEHPTRIDTPHLSLEVYRESPDELGLKVLTAGAGSFALPQMGGILNGSGIVDVSTIATPTNPFEDVANRIHSVVMTTEIRNASGGISVSNLDKPIDIRLPRDPKPVPSLHLYKATAGKMIFHKFDVRHNDSSINIDLHLVGNCSERANFILFLQKDRKPSVLKHMFNITVPDSKVKDKFNGSKSPNTFFLSNVDLKRDAAGTFYVGVMYNRPDVECPEFMNYTVDFFTSGCLYFDKELNIWKGDGCTVGFLTNLNETQCLCNHLTSFGGDFMVPPNSIDWDAVSAGFTNLDENPLVFAVVVSIIGVYFILLVWVRRVDKKDLKEFVTIPLPDNDPRDNYNYEVVVYTGHPKYSGTTAKVFIIISGSRDETEPRALLDSTNTALKPGGVDTFILSVPSSLGKLDHVRIWHDNSGESPSWYLNRILVRDVQTDRKTWFLCDQWLAVEEDDGLIERVLPAATKDDLVSFNFLFSIEARRKLFDEHLWFSVLSRRPRSQFTRVQRLSCCLAVLLSTMLANAMFYQTDDSSSSGNQVRAGPLVFSLKQLWIGFISCLVILPANLLIVYIFRNVRPKEGRNDGDKNSGNAQEYALNEGNENELSSDPTENLVSCSKTSLPRKFIYVAYILLFLTISISATFTIFYGFTFGKEKSEKWISSTLLSFFQDLMLLQPLKVFAAATFIALIIKDPNKVDQGDKSDSKPEMIEQVEDQQAGDEEQSINGDDNFREPTTPRSVVKPPAESELVAARELRTKQKIMRHIISEVCWYISYLVLISIVAYGNRDPKAYLVTKTMNDMFVENKYAARLRLNDISSIPQYWSWLHNSILSAINPPYWYGPYGLDDIETISKTIASKSRAKAKSKSSKTKSSGSSGSDDLEVVYHGYPKRFTADRAVSYIVGLARARQLRNAPQDSCNVHPTVRHLNRQCSQEYSWSNEDEGCYNVSWSAYNGSAHSCQQMKGGRSPWTYHTAWDLKGTPFWGKFHNYWGGGYVWNVDTSLSVVQKERKLLEEQSWLDHQTRAVFFEFTIYNAFTNFFCSVTLLLEKQITGGIYPYGQLHSLRLYHYVGAEAFVTLVCEIIFVCVLCYIFTRELKEARSRGIKNYFKDPWNYFDILGLVFSFTAIGLYFARIAATSLALRRINENRSSFVSFHYVSAVDQSFTILLALAIFVYFLKVLRLLRFNRKISLLSTTLIACASTLFGFLLTYMLLFAAYAQLVYIVYGRDMPEFASYQRCLSSLMEMTLGSSDFDGMNATNRILTGFIFFSYTVLNMCVYMNLFISILSETFSEVRADVLLQPNDHEIVDFMIKSVKKSIFRAVEPVTNPIYREPKDDIDLGVDRISETSECIQGALQGLCKEDIRQTLWFGDKSKMQEKGVLLNILLESGEILSENDIGDAVPLFDDILKKFSMEDLLLIRDNQRRKIASELAKSFSSSNRRTRFSPRESSAILSDESDDGDDDSMEVNGTRDHGEGTVSGENGGCWSRAGDDGDNDGDGGGGGNINYNSDGRYSDKDGDYDDGAGYGGGDNDGGCDNHGDGDGGDGNIRGDSDSDDRYSDGDYDDSDGYDGGDNDNDGGGDGNTREDYDGDGRYSDRGGDDNDGGNSDGYSDGVDQNDRPTLSNYATNDGGSDSDGDGNHPGDQSDDGSHSETDHEDNPRVNQPNQGTIDQHDSGKHDGDNQHGNTENFRSSSPLSPRSNACVIFMETNKEE